MTGADVVVHAAAHLGDWGHPAEFERVNVQGTRNVVDAARRAGRAAGRPRRDRGGAPARPAARRRRRAHAAGLRLARPLQRHEGPRRGGRARGRPRRAGDRRRAAAVRLGRGRHDAPAGHDRDGPVGALRVDRRRPPADVDVARRQRRRGPACSPPTRGATRGRRGSSRTARRSSSASSSRALLATQGVAPPDRSVPLPVARALAGAGERAWRQLRLPGRPPVTRFSVWVSALECTLSDARARRDLGYAPLVTPRGGTGGAGTVGRRDRAAARLLQPPPGGRRPRGRRRHRPRAGPPAADAGDDRLRELRAPGRPRVPRAAS